MALFALPAVNRSSQQTASCHSTASLDNNIPSTAESSGILHAIQQSVLPGSRNNGNVTVTLLKPLTAGDDLAELQETTQSLQEARSESELHQVFQNWLGQSVAEAQKDDSASPRGWIVVKPDSMDARGLGSLTGSANLWPQSESELLRTQSKLFTIMSEHDPSASASMAADSTFPALFTTESAPWHKGPSPTLGPLIVEDPFADIDCTSDLMDLNHHTRASSAFDDQSSSFMSSRRTSIHSLWHSDNMTMSRSASTSSSSNATSSFEKSTAVKFAKIDVDVEIQTFVIFKAARTRPDSSSFLDRTEAGRLLTFGASYPQ